MKPALLVIDIQEAFFDIDQQTTQSLEHAIEYVNAAIALFRSRQLPVIVVQHMDAEHPSQLKLPPNLSSIDSARVRRGRASCVRV